MKFFITLMIGVSLLFSAVDINTADKKELLTLHGIGSSKADAIIEHREKECFKDINDLATVKGIGVKTVQKNSENLSASECK